MSSFVFIDARVAGIEGLIAELATDVRVVVLDPARDGVAQIAAALAGTTDLDSIHIVSHDTEGALYLDSTIFTAESMDGYREALAQIGAALAEDGDLLLYGCETGAGAGGQSFIEELALYTDADVAASSDPTGSLYYDPDGTGAAAAKLFATLAAAPAVTHADFLVIA